VPEPTEVERELPADRAIIEYVVGSRQIAIFVLRHDGLQAMLEPVRAADLESKITLLRDLIRRPDSADWQLPAGSLRHLLVVTAGMLLVERAVRTFSSVVRNGSAEPR